MYGILSNKVIETVEKIVFERARKFMLGIHKDDIDRDIMHALLSEGVIAQQGDYIRLKYDIFEDICFEHYFDKAFDLCKGKYKTFYDEIENLGRCVYRRYQIWISNKMFIQVNRDKFLLFLMRFRKVGKGKQKLELLSQGFVIIISKNKGRRFWNKACCSTL